MKIFIKFFSTKFTQIITQTLFFYFEEMKTIPLKIWMDGHNLEFDAQTFIGHAKMILMVKKALFRTVPLSKKVI